MSRTSIAALLLSQLKTLGLSSSFEALAGGFYVELNVEDDLYDFLMGSFLLLKKPGDI